MITKTEVACIEEAHALEITSAVNYFTSFNESLGERFNPLESSLFVTGAKDKCIKVWELF